MGLNYCINGRFLTRRVTGVDRYAREIVAELDKLSGGVTACILIPEKAKLVDCPRYKQIEIVRFGSREGYAWEQLDLPRYAGSRSALTVNLCNTAPIRNAGITCIHDMSVRANPIFYNWKFRLVYNVLFYWEMRTARTVITVSDFSRREIERYYPGARGKIGVVPNAWQHVERVKSDAAVLAQNDLEPGSYYFAMSSLAPNKNLRWIVETARLNPRERIAVAGGVNSKVFGEHEIPKADNVTYLGYVTDEGAKALMEGCKGFLFPTFYEGFGIPPMEALACGAPVAVSDTEVMREVYGNSAHYVDPRRPCESLAALFAGRTDEASAVLSRYSWKRSARELEILLRKLQAGNREGDKH